MRFSGRAGSDEAFQAVLGGQDASAALAEAQRKAEALVECLQTAGDLDDRAQARVCARQIDPDYPLDEE